MTSVHVQCAQGLLRGEVGPGGVLVFRGVPYAVAPVGPLRWRPPAPPAGWPGERDATAAGAYCPQYDIDNIGLFAPPAMTEDCLFLNVWTPAIGAGRRPVLVWIHGGGFETGSGAPYSGAVLAPEQDIVLVTINYRLNAFGFPPFQLFGPEVSPNLGLLDQIAALRWVQDNIVAFGGDPGNVAIAGQSAGGWSVGALMAAPQAQGLFHKALPVSGSVFATRTAKAEAAARAAFAADCGIADLEPAAMLALTTEQVLAAGRAVHLAWRETSFADGDRSRAYMPIRDGLLLAADPLELVDGPTAFDGPVLIGVTANEVGFAPFRAADAVVASGYSEAAMIGVLNGRVGEARSREIWAAYRQVFPHLGEQDIAGHLRSDLDYRMPTIALASARARVGRRNWMYEFALTSPTQGIATHALDLPFWFGGLGSSPLARFFLGRPPNQAELVLARTMRDDLGAFLRHGDPGWPAYDLETRMTRIYDLTVGEIGDPHAERRRLHGL